MCIGQEKQRACGRPSRSRLQALPQARDYSPPCGLFALSGHGPLVRVTKARRGDYNSRLLAWLQSGAGGATHGAANNEDLPVDLPINHFKRALASGPVPLGAWLGSGAPSTAEALGCAGFDFLVVDMEHTPIDTPQMVDILRAIACMLQRVAGVGRLVLVEARDVLEAHVQGIDA